uniref:Uncharacterized protein n=1 Tax=Arundo donax TaxID=35708 RepID=A0A0A9A6E2_ARUDO
MLPLITPNPIFFLTNSIHNC